VSSFATTCHLSHNNNKVGFNAHNCVVISAHFDEIIVIPFYLLCTICMQPAPAPLCLKEVIVRLKLTWQELYRCKFYSLFKISLPHLTALPLRQLQQIIELVEDSDAEGDKSYQFKAREDNLELIFNKIPKDLKVAVVSVVGNFRTGKSFLLTFMLRYLRNRYLHCYCLIIKVTLQLLSDALWFPGIAKELIGKRQKGLI
jgi:hypothetical protein